MDYSWIDSTENGLQEFTLWFTGSPIPASLTEQSSSGTAITIPEDAGLTAPTSTDDKHSGSAWSENGDVNGSED